MAIGAVRVKLFFQLFTNTLKKKNKKVVYSELIFKTKYFFV
jgi:hypothetical protein